MLCVPLFGDQPRNAQLVKVLHFVSLLILLQKIIRLQSSFDERGFVFIASKFYTLKTVTQVRAFKSKYENYFSRLRDLVCTSV